MLHMMNSHNSIYKCISYNVSGVQVASVGITLGFLLAFFSWSRWRSCTYFESAVLLQLYSVCYSFTWEKIPYKLFILPDILCNSGTLLTTISLQATTSTEHTLSLRSFEEEQRTAILFVTFNINKFSYQSIEEVDPVDLGALLGSAGGMWGEIPIYAWCMYATYNLYLRINIVVGSRFTPLHTLTPAGDINEKYLYFFRRMAYGFP